MNNSYKAWAKYYQIKYFTVGIQSIQRVEVMNRIIKEDISSITLLYNLYMQTQKLLDNEVQ